MDVRQLITGMVVTGVLGAGAMAQSATLHSLGVLGERDSASYAHGLSSDGVHIVGGCVTPGRKDGPPIVMKAVRWEYPAGGSPSKAMELGAAATQTDFGSLALAVSDDGERIVGSVGLVFETFYGLQYTAWQGMYWWDISSPEMVADWTGEAMEFTDISADGSVVCGTTRAGFFEPIPGDPILWNGPGSAAMVLGTLGGNGQAFAVSADGGTIVGESFNVDGGAVNAFRWTAGEGLIQLPNTESSVWQTAMGVSPDGAYVVGALGGDAGFWTEETGMQSIGRGKGSSWAYAVDMTEDAGAAVGHSVTDDGETRVSEAFIWDAANGLRPLAGVLADEYGVDLTGWRLEAATGVSDDGRTIIGYGTAPSGRVEAWVVRVGEGGCRADFNGDGVVNSQDFFDFLAAFFEAEASADFNTDGVVNSQDFFDFLGVFFTGC